MAGRYPLSDRWAWDVNLDLSTSERGGGNLDGFTAVLYRITRDPWAKFVWKVGPAASAEMEDQLSVGAGGLVTCEF